MSSDRIEINQLGLTAENGNVILEGSSRVARTAEGETIEDPAGWQSTACILHQTKG